MYAQIAAYTGDFGLGIITGIVITVTTPALYLAAKAGVKDTQAWLAERRDAATAAAQAAAQPEADKATAQAEAIAAAIAARLTAAMGPTHAAAAPSVPAVPSAPAAVAAVARSPLDSDPAGARVLTMTPVCAVLGDSIAADVAAAMPECRRDATVGIGSAAYSARVIHHRADESTVIISLGANDDCRGRTEDNLEAVRRATTAVSVVWLMPASPERATVAVRNVAARHGDRVIDTAPFAGRDRLHRRPQGAVASRTPCGLTEARQESAHPPLGNTSQFALPTGLDTRAGRDVQQY